MNASTRAAANRKCDEIGDGYTDFNTGKFKYRNKILAIKHIRDVFGCGICMAKAYVDLREENGRFPFRGEAKAKINTCFGRTPAREENDLNNIFEDILEYAEEIDGPVPQPWVYKPLSPGMTHPTCDFDRECAACDAVYHLNPENARGNAWRYCSECRKDRPFKAAEQIAAPVIGPLGPFGQMLRDKYGEETFPLTEYGKSLFGRI